MVYSVEITSQEPGKKDYVTKFGIAAPIKCVGYRHLNRQTKAQKPPRNMRRVCLPSRCIVTKRDGGRSDNLDRARSNSMNTPRHSFMAFDF